MEHTLTIIFSVAFLVVIYGLFALVANAFGLFDDEPDRPKLPEPVDLNPIEYPISEYTEQEDTPTWPSFPPRSTEDMELS